MKHSEKVCTIVGAGPGISLSVAKRFAREGFSIALIARRVENIERQVQELKEMGVLAKAYSADAADHTSLEKAFRVIHREIGYSDVLVYNAFVGREASPSKLDPEKLVQDFRVNVVGALSAAQLAIPNMKKQKSGTILFTGGGLSLEPYHPYASLAVGKAGIRNLTYSLAAELAPLGIHVATITITGIVKPGTHFDPDKIAEVYWKLHAQKTGQFETEVLYK
ncbi:SDR family NAD(P)-dependent oxidoreductase [Xanthocytophaga agilis]|uniref:SDR family NAD(P)-dependent oxidoreductase n=1 Tax=Xanthocytophaga agilis TaxID=3048010 RepID=A0AAE3RCJ1_9BACT|nr:SDR family NAD(P)-dependent oxidoreductase [Xanthocytophaga agilis]MDJ1505103.1 SDR family NAD(P)-dependent oxidoreductase [Xanthocytophaga agilis]